MMTWKGTRWIPIGLLLMGGAFVDTSSVRAESGIQPESKQELQEKQQRLGQQNQQESERLQAPALKDRSADVPPYKENQEIGGQKQAGPADFPQPAFPFVKGQLTQIEGDYYIVKDAEGKEIRVHVDKGTKINGTFHVGDMVEVQRTLQGHALMINPGTGSPSASSSASSSGQGANIKDEQVTLGGAKQAVRGEVLKIEGENYVIKDGQGNEVRLTVNQNTRMFCKGGSFSGLLPNPSASDKSDMKGQQGRQGQQQDLSQTNEQPGSEVGPGTKSGKAQASATGDCAFKKGDMVEAEVSDMGAATFIKLAGRPQPGQPLP